MFHSSPMDIDLKIFCLVEGEPISMAFSVKVSSADTDDDLKKVIKAEKSPRFDDIAADELKLWRVSIPYIPTNRDITVSLDSLDIKEQLDPISVIADVFQESPAKRAIHIMGSAASIR
ncbi:hypothetical protein EC973_006014 [Apophysomyces ossiformis]|uniref:Crinkler effector protein N-terminal domain-containing protein n=1 Tax=Apophysomyces ossiformis TaxID=679940 RepID=A0A8H7BR31_9FUNG|nr:hypothetical protein EC973_006014 [Apophysomyces ossiformis]